MDSFSSLLLVFPDVFVIRLYLPSLLFFPQILSGCRLRLCIPFPADVTVLYY